MVVCGLISRRLHPDQISLLPARITILIRPREVRSERLFLRTAIPVGAPPSGRWVVVCEALSRRGHRSHKKPDAMSGSNRIMTTPAGLQILGVVRKVIA